MINFEDKINAISDKIVMLQEIYDANMVSINHPDTIIPGESDYDLSRCLETKLELELKINALESEKLALTNQG